MCMHALTLAVSKTWPPRQKYKSEYQSVTPYFFVYSLSPKGYYIISQKKHLGGPPHTRFKPCFRTNLALRHVEPNTKNIKLILS